MQPASLTRLVRAASGTVSLKAHDGGRRIKDSQTGIACLYKPRSSTFGVLLCKSK